MSIYISFAHEDLDFALWLAQQLMFYGFSVELANSAGIPGGENWSTSVEDAIRRASTVIAVMSPASEQSTWVQQEILRARQIGKPLIPVLVESTDRSPWYLQDLQVIDFGETFGSPLMNLVHYLNSRSSTESTGKPSPSPDKLSAELERLEESPSTDRVFIAYAREQRSTAKALAELLHKHGKEYFYDAHIRAGARWRQAVQMALDDATHMVVIWTPEAANSDEVEREVSYALGEGIYIIPLLSPEIPKLPYHLYGVHYILLNNSVQDMEIELLAAFDHRSPHEGLWQ